MKRSYIYLLLAFFIVSGLDAFADVAGHIQTVAQNNTMAKKSNSPYLDSKGDVVTVADLKNIKDDEYVTLRGYIVKKIKKEKYLFKDSTGEITLDIDKKINNQLKNVDEKTLIEVYGEYDKEYIEKNEIDVKKITIVK